MKALRLLFRLKERVNNPYSRLKLSCSLLIILLILLSVFCISSADAEYEQTGVQNNTGFRETSQDTQDERIAELHRRLDDAVAQIAMNQRRIEDLQHDVTLYKGSVLGIGSLLAILELLQAMGVVKGRLSSTSKQ